MGKNLNLEEGHFLEDLTTEEVQVRSDLGQ
jgi:hypothetical protein